MTTLANRAAAMITLAALPISLLAQSPPAPPGGAAATYLERYGEIAALAPLAGQVAEVSHLVLSRDVGEITLEHGQLYLLSPIGGRTVGAVFRGAGRFRFAPTDRTEQTLMQRFANAPALDVPLTEAILLFADSTARQIRRLSFGPAPVPDDVTGHVRDLVRSLMGEHQGSFDSDVMGPLLNGDTAGFFLAHVTRTRGDPVLFQVNTALAEAVQLFRPVSRREWGANWALVTRFSAHSQPASETRAWRFRGRLRVTSYRMDVRLTERFSADLSLAASATLALVADARVGPWLHLSLDPGLDVDSARWGTGEPALPFKADDDGDLWVRAPRAALPGDTLALTIFYHGNVIDRHGDWFYIDPVTSWYPGNGQGEGPALFDVTYHSPIRYPLVSTGERVDSSRAGSVVTTRWVSRAPVYHATFNLGLFRIRHIQHPGAPAIDVLISEDAHALLRRSLLSRGIFLPQQRNMSESVGADISNSLALFTNLYGDPSFEHFFVTEIPYDEGLSFPGMINLSWGTFQNTSLDGFDEFFRAHEAAHQWWGIGIRPATYRDAWLSEGLASFSALSYLQTARRRNDEYYRFLDQYRSNVLAHRDEAGPMWIGYRNATPETPRGYSDIVYEKGAWIFHMLRLMLLDLNTLRADRFTAMLREYYQSFGGGTASTHDFAAVVERHFGASMLWFFDQWVRRAEIPTYRVAWTHDAAEGGRFRVRLRVSQERVPSEFRMPVVVAVDLGNNRTARFRVEVHGGQTEYTSPLLPAQPLGLTFNEFRSVLAEVRMERW